MNKEKFHKVKSVKPIEDFVLSVEFVNGVKKSYDVKRLFLTFPEFNYFQTHKDAFYNVHVDIGGYGIVWSDYLDLSSDELWDNGKE